MPADSPNELSPADLATLVEVAERSITLAVRDRVTWCPKPTDYAPILREPRAAFVTLKRSDRLRGCIGTMVGDRPLVECVADRARAAAFDDPRFDSVRPDELADLDIDVSVLSPMEPFTVADYDSLVHSLRAGRDGLLVEAGPYRATFLPSVWEELPQPTDFVAALWRKARMPPKSWPSGIKTYLYITQHAG